VISIKLEKEFPMNFEKNEPMYYVQSDFDHLKYCYELLKANFSDNTRDTPKDGVLSFGVLITSWATYYRSLFDFFNPREKKENEQYSDYIKRLKGQHDDILIVEVVNEEPFNTFNNVNLSLIKNFEDKLNTYECQPNLNAKNKLEDIKLKINKLISHLTQDRITTFENGYYVWEVENCSEYIIKAYESLIKVLKVVEDNQFENFDEVNTKKISSNEENSSPNIVSENKLKDSFAAYTTSGIIINSPRSKLK
jgi:hypothetical protein